MTDFEGCALIGEFHAQAAHIRAAVLAVCLTGGTLMTAEDCHAPGKMGAVAPEAGPLPFGKEPAAACPLLTLNLLRWRICCRKNTSQRVPVQQEEERPPFGLATEAIFVERQRSRRGPAASAHGCEGRLFRPSATGNWYQPPGDWRRRVG